MNREQEFDQTLKQWLDDGADRAPERFVWAAIDDVERTAQRGAWRASLEGVFMHLKPAAPILGVAAVVLVAIVSYQLLAAPNLGDENPTLRTFTAEDLPSIILTARNAPAGMTVEEDRPGEDALVLPLRPGGPLIDRTGFVDARNSNIDHTDTGGYVSWSALFETAEDAQRAFDFLATEHESDEGWGMQRSGTAPALGDESARYTGAAYDWDRGEVYLWRVNNLVLAAVGVGDFDRNQLRTISEEMEARAR